MTLFCNLHNAKFKVQNMNLFQFPYAVKVPVSFALFHKARILQVLAGRKLWVTHVYYCLLFRTARASDW